jgi:hypothetical protein
MRRRPAVALTLAVACTLAACGSNETHSAVKTSGADSARESRSASTLAARMDAYDAERKELAPSAADMGHSVAGGATDDVATPAPVDSHLNAGSVDDNEKWEDFLRYRDDFLASGVPAHDVDVTNRYVLHVVDGDGKPVRGAHVELRNGSDVLATRTTYADGRTLVFPPRPSGQDTSVNFTLAVSKGDAKTSVTLDRETRDQKITLKDAPVDGGVKMDIEFLLDATGSMGDEIEQLKANMVSVAEQVDKMSPRPDVRFAITSYRDRGDEYVTRTVDFTGDLAAFTESLRAVVADGGGDTPESLNAGLHDAIAKPTWRDDAIKLVFLVADAAPHLDYTDDADYAKEMDVAAQQGIKIHPIASSGLDDQGEYVMRQLAQYTTGRFNFLTYGADGVSPGDQTTHHVDDYSVLSLDELVVQLVKDELGAISATPDQVVATSTTVGQ